MPPLRRLLRALLLACALAPSCARAQAELVVDNDLFGLRGAGDAPPDYDYTHGTVVRWSGGSRLAARVLGGPACAGGEADGCAHGRWAAGQRIYTPRRDAPEPVPGERPYAGWLFGAWEGARIRGRVRSTARLEAGVTGRPSLAEPVQNTLHRLAGYERQRGWAHEVPFEPAFVAEYGREYRLLSAGAADGWSVDVLPAWNAGLGTRWTGAGAGLRARLGVRAGDAWTGAGAGGGLAGWAEVGARREMVLRDLTLDGSTFGGGPRAGRRTWVAQAEAAVGARYGRMEIVYRFVVRGREYRAQEEPHPYGSITFRPRR